MNFQSEDQSNAFLSETKLEKLGKNYLDFIASAESKFPLLFGRDAQIRKFKKFKAAKLEYQQGARGGKYSELGTKKDILNKLSQNKLLERRLKKEMLKKCGNQRINGGWKSEASREPKRGIVKTGKRFHSQFRAKKQSKRAKKDEVHLPVKIQKMNTEERSSIRRTRSLRRSFKGNKPMNCLGNWIQSSQSKENSNRQNLGNETKKYKIKKSKSNFFFKKKKIFLKSESSAAEPRDSILTSYLRIKRLKNQK